MPVFKVWNVKLDWENAQNEEGERIHSAPPMAKAGSLVFAYPKLGESIDINTTPPNAGAMDAEKREQIERGNRKRLDRIIEFSNGKLSLIEPGQEPSAAPASQVVELEAENAELKRQIAELETPPVPKATPRRRRKSEEEE